MDQAALEAFRQKSLGEQVEKFQGLHTALERGAQVPGDGINRIIAYLIDELIPQYAQKELVWFLADDAAFFMRYSHPDQTPGFIIQGVTNPFHGLRAATMKNLPALIGSVKEEKRAQFIIETLTWSAFDDVREATLRHFAKSLAPHMSSVSRVAVIEGYKTSGMTALLVELRKELIACVDERHKRQVSATIPSIVESNDHYSSYRPARYAEL